MADRVVSSDLLKSWKEIAVYFDRDVRTVIRWERDRALPIHRPPGSKRAGAVFAYRSELDSWMLGSGKGPDVDQLDPQSLASKSVSFPHFQTGRRRLLISGSLSFLVIAATLLSAFSSVSRRGLQLPLQLTRTDYYPGNQPMGIVAADLNNDGIPDLVISNSKDDTIAVLLGEGDGTFASPVAVPAKGEPWYIAVADFNHDGNLDVATHTHTSLELQVFLGDGTGHLHKKIETPLPGGSKAITSGDLNGDGNFDLVVVRPNAKSVQVMMGKGDGSFQTGVNLLQVGLPGPAILADVNDDKKLDIIVCDYNAATGNTVSVYLGRGDGTFESRHPYRTGGGPLYVAATDINRDGKVDLVTADYQAGVSVLLGAGDGTFGPPKSYAAGKANTYVVITDFDEDGLPDILALGMHDDSLVFLRGHGDGQFDPPEKFPTGRYPDVIAVADFDKDGRSDVAVTNSWTNSTSVYMNRSPHQKASWLSSALR